jgi:hypothetical protein
VLLIFDNLVEPTKGVHGVVVTHLLAKEELRVRFSLDALVRLQGTKQSVKYTSCLIGKRSGLFGGL